MKRLLLCALVTALLLSLSTVGISCTNKSMISFNPSCLDFSAIQGQSNPPGQLLAVWNSGKGTINWSITGNATWLNLSPTSGISTNKARNGVTVAVGTSGMSAGNYSTSIAITALGATNTPQTIPVSLTMNPMPKPCPAAPTGYNVGTFDGSFANSWGSNSVTIYYPAISSGTSQRPDRSCAPYPSVVFVGGWMLFKGAYTWAGKMLASDGYIVAVVQVPNVIGTDDQQWADAIKDGISYLQMQNSSASVLQGMIKGVFGAAGHSMGGGGVLLAASQDSRIRAVVSMAPPSPCMMVVGKWLFQKIYDGIAMVRVPVQILAGSKDTIVRASVSQVYYSVLGRPKESVVISGAGHKDYIDILSNPSYLGIVEKYTKNWFDYYLKGDTSSKTYIFGCAAQNDLTIGALSALDFAP